MFAKITSAREHTGATLAGVNASIARMLLQMFDV